MDKAIATPSRTRQILKTYDLSAKKSLGQNFIVDPNIMEKIISIGQIDNQTAVIEVGPGIGALTQYLAEYAKTVLALEIDQRFIPVLAEELKAYENLTVLEADALKVDLEALVNRYVDPSDRLVLAANLPYYVTTPILLHFLHAPIPLQSMTVMVQKEVAERIAAQPATKAYGSLSIAVQYYMGAELAATVPPSVFRPAPHVDSAIIHLTKRPQPLVAPLRPDFFFDLVRLSFAQRRKTLRNNLLAALGRSEEVKAKVDQALEGAGLDPKVRGEALTIHDFGRLADECVRLGLDTDE